MGIIVDRVLFPRVKSIDQGITLVLIKESADG